MRLKHPSQVHGFLYQRAQLDCILEGHRRQYRVNSFELVQDAKITSY